MNYKENDFQLVGIFKVRDEILYHDFMIFSSHFLGHVGMTLVPTFREQTLKTKTLNPTPPEIFSCVRHWPGVLSTGRCIHRKSLHNLHITILKNYFDLENSR